MHFTNQLPMYKNTTKLNLWHVRQRNDNSSLCSRVMVCFHCPTPIPTLTPIPIPMKLASIKMCRTVSTEPRPIPMPIPIPMATVPILAPI